MLLHNPIHLMLLVKTSPFILFSCAAAGTAGPQGGGLTETHRKAQLPHKVSTPFHCFHQMILPSLFTSRDPLILPEKCQITSSQPLLVLDW